MYFSFYPSTTVSFHHALEVRTQLSSPPSVPFKKIFAGLLFLGRAEWFLCIPWGSYHPGQKYEAVNMQEWLLLCCHDEDTVAYSPWPLCLLFLPPSYSFDCNCSCLASPRLLIVIATYRLAISRGAARQAKEILGDMGKIWVRAEMTWATIMQDFAANANPWYQGLLHIRESGSKSVTNPLTVCRKDPVLTYFSNTVHGL